MVNTRNWYDLDTAEELDDAPTMAERITAQRVAQQASGGPNPYKGVLESVRAELTELLTPEELRQPDDRVKNQIAELARRHIAAYQTRAQTSNLARLSGSSPAGLPGDIDDLVKKILDDVVGLGPLQPLLDAPGIEDIAINGPGEVYIFQNGRWTRSRVVFPSAEELTSIVNRAINHTNRQVSSLAPRVDAQMRCGSRINILHPSIANPGPAVTIRRYSAKAMTMFDLVRSGSGLVRQRDEPEKITDYSALGIWDGTITPQAATFLEMCVLARMNIIVVGGTGAGKTTLLNALAELIPKEQRIVTIEDTRELRIRQRPDGPAGASNNVVNLCVRIETVEGAEGINQQELLQTALRMRPDRIIVGEVRGAEALDLLMAHNTGHDGGLATIHANSLAEVAKRLSQMIQLNDLSIKIDRRTVAEWVAGAFQIGVFISRDPATNRRAITQIVEYTGQVEGEAVLSQVLFDFSDGTLHRTPYRLHQDNLLARIGHSYESIVRMDQLTPWASNGRAAVGAR